MLMRMFVLAGAITFAAGPSRTTKTPGSTEDFYLDLACVKATDTACARSGTNEIVSSSWVIPAGITQVSAASTATKALIRLSGGSLRIAYTLRNLTTLADGQVLENSLVVEIAQQ